jgi:chromosome segregation ATPase
VVNYPGHKRVNDIRTRLARLRHDTDSAVEEVAHLRREIDGLRAELKAISTSVGDQLASQGSAIERLQNHLDALERRDS